jgi:hypothetical protein
MTLPDRKFVSTAVPANTVLEHNAHAVVETALLSALKVVAVLLATSVTLSATSGGVKRSTQHVWSGRNCIMKSQESHCDFIAVLTSRGRIAAMLPAR